MRYLQAVRVNAHTHARTCCVDSTSIEWLFSINPLPGLKARPAIYSKGRKLKLKATFESSISLFTFKRGNQALSTRVSTGFNLHHPTQQSARQRWQPAMAAAAPARPRAPSRARARYKIRGGPKCQSMTWRAILLSPPTPVGC